MNIEEMNRQSSMEYGGPAIGAWPTRKGEKLRPHKGGGGGDGGAREMEAERQARIQAATDQINNIFNNRTQQTSTVYRDASGNTITPQQYEAMAQQGQAKQGVASKSPSRIMGGYGDAQATYDTTPVYERQEVSQWVDGDPANSRQKLYDEQRSAVYDLNKTDVERQAEEAERANRFGLARSGLLGGSTDIDSNSDLNRRTNEGLIRAGSIADSASADLRRQDEQTRSNLISLAQSGIDTGTASQMALSGLNTNAAQAAGARGGATVGGLFNDLSQAYLYRQQAQGANAGYGGQQGGQWYGVSDPRSSYQGG